MFIFEQVANFKEIVKSECAAMMNALKYEDYACVQSTIIDSLDLGFPQSHKSLFVVGVLNEHLLRSKSPLNFVARVRPRKSLEDVIEQAEGTADVLGFADTPLKNLTDGSKTIINAGIDSCILYVEETSLCALALTYAGARHLSSTA